MNDFKFIKNESEFHKNRQSIIGASDIPIILGLSTFTTPYDLYRQKLGLDKNFYGNNATRWGNLHEMNILGSYIEEKTNYDTSLKFKIDYLKNYKLRKPNYKPPTKYFAFTEFYHPDFKFAMCHPDLIDIENEINIEAKSGRQFASFKRDGMDGFDKSDNTESGIPLKYFLQIQWQMLCTGIHHTTLRALIDTSDELNYEIKYNKKIAEKLIEAASRFQWHIVNQKEPMPVNKSDIEKLYPETQDKTSYLLGSDSELALKMVDRKKFLSDRKNKIEDELEDINNALFVYIGGNKYLYSENNEKLCSQVLYDKESVASLKDLEKHPEIFKLLKENNLIKKYQIRYIR
jgi:predicted phage-related endonuclease